MSVLLLLLLSFVFRSPAASWYIQRKVDRFNRGGEAVLAISRVRLTGLASVRMEGITLTPLSGDTLLKIDTLSASVGIFKLLAGRVSLHDVEMANAAIRCKSDGGKTNYGFLLRRKSHAGDIASRQPDYALAADRLMQFVFDKIPLSVDIRNFSIEGIMSGHRLGFRVARFRLDDHYFRTAVEVAEDTQESRWTVAGRIDNAGRTAEFRLFSADTGKVTLPWLQYRWNARVRFDTIAFSFGERRGADGLALLQGFISVSGLLADHPAIAAVPVEFGRAAISYVVNIGRDYAELDSASLVTFNRIGLHPYLRYRPRPTAQITFRVHKPQFPAQDLFSSFPRGLFTNLDGIRVKGNLSWNLDFFVDLAMPDSLVFSTSLDRHQFGVISYGNADLAKINEPFEYTAYDGGNPVKTFTVGPANPDFRTLDRISPYLQHAVMTSEDGGFYQHRGFLPDAFRESLITNIRERRFARGGSTISMQLVKNVFLSRNKTVSRKLEEALIVWLIENQGLSTKDRMFEVYLNIIEWGPMIYGANEASHFYFSRDASRLTLAEAIFMASIIPRPKGFKYSFDENGRLRESNAGFYRLVSEKMLAKGWITPEEAAGLHPEVVLKGPARLLLKQADPAPADTLE